MTYLKITGEQTTWINLVDPTPIDIEGLRRSLPFLHPLNLEDMMSATERPKIDSQPDYLYITLHVPLWDANNRVSRRHSARASPFRNVGHVGASTGGCGSPARPAARHEPRILNTLVGVGRGPRSPMPCLRKKGETREKMRLGTKKVSPGDPSD